MNIPRNWLLLLFPFFVLCINAQTIAVEIPWTASQTLVKGGISYTLPTIANQIPSDGVLRFKTTFPVKTYALAPSLENVNSLLATPEEVTYLNSMGIEIPRSFNPEMK